MRMITVGVVTDRYDMNGKSHLPPLLGNQNIEVHLKGYSPHTIQVKKKKG